MKKVVLKLELYDEEGKKKAMRAVSGLEGLDSISMDMKDKKLTVTGDIDPVELVARLRKLFWTKIVSVGPAKEGKKKDPMDELTELLKGYQKVVLKLELYDEKGKKKAMRAVSGLEGLDSISMDMKDKKLTITGDIDPLELVARFRKLYRTEIVSVGPAKEGKRKYPKDELNELLKAYQAHYRLR